MTKIISSLLVSATLIFVATAASAKTVTVTMTHSNVALTGELISENGLHYVVETDFGTMQVAKSAATCTGCAPTIVGLLN